MSGAADGYDGIFSLEERLNKYLFGEMNNFVILAASNQEICMTQDNASRKATGKTQSDMHLFSSFQNPEDNLPLSQKLIDFSDQFSEFVCINAFLSEAFSNMLAEQEAMNDEIVRGALYCAESLRTRSFELKRELDQVRERYLAEHVQQLDQDDSP
jgi:hypothetical protein